MLCLYLIALSYAFIILFSGTTSPVISVLPQNTVNRTPAATKEPTPVIANVISLSSSPNAQPGVLGNTILQGEGSLFFKVTFS